VLLAHRVDADASTCFGRFTQLFHAATLVHDNPFLKTAAVEFKSARVVIDGWLKRKAIGGPAKLSAESVAHGEFVGAARRLHVDILYEWQQTTLRLARLEIRINVTAMVG